MHSKAVVRASGQKQAGSSWVGGFGPDLDGFHLKSAHLLGHRCPLVEVTDPARRVRLRFVHDGVDKAERAVGRAAEAVDVVAVVKLHAGLAPAVDHGLLIRCDLCPLVEVVDEDARLKSTRATTERVSNMFEAPLTLRRKAWAELQETLPPYLLAQQVAV